MTKQIRSLSLLLAAAAFAAWATPAQAVREFKRTFGYPASITVTDLCAFPVDIDSTVSLTWMRFVRQNGTVMATFQVTEQDTFSANQQTLQGLPYTYLEVAQADANGELTGLVQQGEFEKVPLPDGSLFLSAGRIDLLAHPDAQFIVTPDVGQSGDVAALCAALAP
ncbi:hypothetical protein [Anaeromyxobacter paludicola]|uniref:Uncharacterized protein n=1 Tax=Anaeromyxobacter paludicola TaxID=2918171 RepID=A0ABM7X9M6_9BACT|nr:hypothetical protein [Anaeromyxobacter paludicola]BDG08559.1 hypothetical protein AMPC_16720 [Anaeromyxobacter paludicola]